MRELIGDQGEVTIVRIDALPADAIIANVEKDSSGHHIISHSESGHHHILTSRGEDIAVMESRTAPAGMKILYAILKNPQSFEQTAPVPHEKFDLPTGVYEFRINRDYDPFSQQARRSMD